MSHIGGIKRDGIENAINGRVAIHPDSPSPVYHLLVLYDGHIRALCGESPRSHRSGLRLYDTTTVDLSNRRPCSRCLERKMTALPVSGPIEQPLPGSPVAIDHPLPQYE